MLNGLVIHSTNGGLAWGNFFGTTLADVTFSGIWGTSESDVFVVGTGGRIFHYE